MSQDYKNLRISLPSTTEGFALSPGSHVKKDSKIAATIQELQRNSSTQVMTPMTMTPRARIANNVSKESLEQLREQSQSHHPSLSQRRGSVTLLQPGPTARLSNSPQTPKTQRPSVPQRSPPPRPSLTPTPTPLPRPPPPPFPPPPSFSEPRDSDNTPNHSLLLSRDPSSLPPPPPEEDMVPPPPPEEEIPPPPPEEDIALTLRQNASSKAFAEAFKKDPNFQKHLEYLYSGKFNSQEIDIHLTYLIKNSLEKAKYTSKKGTLEKKVNKILAEIKLNNIKHELTMYINNSDDKDEKLIFKLTEYLRFKTENNLHVLYGDKKDQQAIREEAIKILNDALDVALKKQESELKKSIEQKIDTKEIINKLKKTKELILLNKFNIKNISFKDLSKQANELKIFYIKNNLEKETDESIKNLIKFLTDKNCFLSDKNYLTKNTNFDDLPELLLKFIIKNLNPKEYENFSTSQFEQIEKNIKNIVLNIEKQKFQSSSQELSHLREKNKTIIDPELKILNLAMIFLTQNENHDSIFSILDKKINELNDHTYKKEKFDLTLNPNFLDAIIFVINQIPGIEEIKKLEKLNDTQKNTYFEKIEYINELQNKIQKCIGTRKIEDYPMMLSFIEKFSKIYNQKKFTNIHR